MPSLKRTPSADELLKSVVSHAPIVLFALDSKGVFTLSIGAGLRALGLKEGQVVGQSIFRLYRGNKSILADARRALGGETFRTEALEKGRSYETRWAPLSDGGALGVAIDVTERRRLEREISEIASREQSRLGSELHDSIGQTLTALSFAAAVLKSAVPRGAAARGAARIDALSRQAIRQMRLLASGLLPHELHGGDVGQALRSLCESAGQLFGLRCRLVLKGDVKLATRAAAVEVYRIAQEAVRNAAKHAKASTGVVLRLDGGARSIRLSIRDDGRGIARRRSATAGLGLAIMRHRAATLGGSLAVGPARGGGTEVLLVFPRP